ncbi:hypothetical protein E3E14_01260 [Streptomyces sp. ICN441]|uniref:hypothetical protein n=1 Tax=Streptomyces sp. ICN441 TaxID=2558286 RepID=UPI00106A1F25|nr:hypothetical protein [Streptomyces sp. ICN441]TFE58501.1 hypothetical protein E3E14_01260 [Streptomyces sp. ICN441]
MRALRTACAAVAALVLAGCATAPARPAPGPPAAEGRRDALIRHAQRILVDRCLAGQGLTSARKPSSEEDDRRLRTALFGSGPTELSLTLPTGHTVHAHTDGCLAAARHTLYGDQRRWFRAEVTVNNLRAEAAARMRADPAHRAAHARFIRCLDPAGEAGTPPRQAAVESRTPPREPAGETRTRPPQAALEPRTPARQSAGEARTRPPHMAAERRCRGESGLASVEARLEPVRLAEVRSLRRAELAAHTRLRTSAAHRAAEISAAVRHGKTPEKGSVSP